ncbi:MAG: hypothetical protein ACI9BW_001893 [Gammaproteobacteria bacterium]|jgi:hypothetical protein
MNKLTVKQTVVLALSIGSLCGPLAAAQSTTLASQAQAPLEILDQNSLEAVVAPIALYPDELLGIVLPGSTFPLQIVQAARYLEGHKSNPALEPNPQWDDTVVALLNYPEVIALLNENLDWTWALGEAVINQQSDVIEAVERFRQRASDAGNLQTDGHKVVSQNDGAIEISSADPQSIYVPYYEPAQVIYPQSTVAYHYYPNRYPVYYYPYATNSHYYASGFWGISTAFSIGWFANRLHLHHYGYRSHPYYGHSFNRSIFRRLGAYDHGRNSRHHRSHNRYGDYWNPGNRHGQRFRHHRNNFDSRRADLNRNNRGTQSINRPSRNTVHRNSVANQFRRPDVGGSLRNSRRAQGVVSGNSSNANRSTGGNTIRRGTPSLSGAIVGANRGAFANASGRRGANVDSRNRRNQTRNATNHRNGPARDARNRRGTETRRAASAQSRSLAGPSALANPRPRSAPAAQNRTNRNANTAASSRTDNIRRERPVNRNTNTSARNRAKTDRPARRSNTDRPAHTNSNSAIGAPGLSAAIRSANSNRGKANVKRAARNNGKSVQRAQSQRRQASNARPNRATRFSASAARKNGTASAQAGRQGFRSQSSRPDRRDSRGSTSRRNNRQANSQRSNRGSFQTQR